MDFDPCPLDLSALSTRVSFSGSRSLSTAASDSASEDSSGSVAAGSSSALSGLSSSSELSSASELSSSTSSWFSCVLSPFPALRQLAGKPEDLGRLPGFELLWSGAV
jgi:hypothetical protein